MGSAHSSNVARPLPLGLIKELENRNPIKRNDPPSISHTPYVKINPGFQPASSGHGFAPDLKHSLEHVFLTSQEFTSGSFVEGSDGLKAPQKGSHNCFGPQGHTASKTGTALKDVGPPVITSPGSLDPVLNSSPFLEVSPKDRSKDFNAI